MARGALPRPLVLLLPLVLGAGPLLAQGPRGFEAGAIGLVTFAEPGLAAGGLTLGWRPGGRIRLATSLLVGGADGLTGRGELAVQYLLAPALLRGAGAYGVAGVAGEAGGRDGGYLMLGLGLEGAPGGGAGWFLEGGVGGGARFAAGWRFRRLAARGRR